MAFAPWPTAVSSETLQQTALADSADEVRVLHLVQVGLGVLSHLPVGITETIGDTFIHFYCKIHLFKSKISRSVIPQNTVRVNCYVARVLPSKACRVRHRAVAAQANKESK